MKKKKKKIKKPAFFFINIFKQTTADIGISNNFDYVICGHIHHPEIKEIRNPEGSIMYLNSGDWVENLSTLECVDGKWSIYRFSEIDKIEMIKEAQEEAVELSNDQLFDNMLHEFNMMRQ